MRKADESCFWIKIRDGHKTIRQIKLDAKPPYFIFDFLLRHFCFNAGLIIHITKQRSKGSIPLYFKGEKKLNNVCGNVLKRKWHCIHAR